MAALVYKVCAADETIPEYICDPCGEGEMGRVRGAAFVDKSLLPELIKTNIENITWWEQQVNAGLINVIPSIRGTYDGGAPNTVTGFGDSKEKTTSKTHTVVFNDQNHKENQLFYQFLENNYKRYILAFRTGSELRVATNNLSSFVAADNVEDDIDSNVLWNCTTTWQQKAPNTLIPIFDLVDDVKDLFSNCLETTTV